MELGAGLGTDLSGITDIARSWAIWLSDPQKFPACGLQFCLLKLISPVAHGTSVIVEG